ncbi:MAG TPA: hypothetical protein DD409_08525 [Bacteroidales bacterium]|nr:hypothetical protein [Bacteroidales bacterium]
MAAYSLRTDEQKALVRAAVEVDKTLFTYGSDQNNIAENNAPLHVWGVEQQVSFPSVYSAAVSSKQRALALAETELAIRRDALKKKVSAAYVELQVMNERKRMFQQLDSLYTHLLEGASRQRELGAISQLDWLTMEAKRQQSRQRLQEAHSKLDAAQAGFKTLLGSDSAFTVSPTLTVLATTGRGIEASPYVDWLQRKEDLDEASLSLERRKLLPDFTFNYFLGTNFQANAKYYHGFEAGVALPLFFGAQQAKIKASKLALASTQQLSAYEVDQLKTKQQELVNARQLYKERMVYFNDKGRQLHDELLRTATLSLQAGDIDVQRFTLSLETALQLKLDYLANVLDYTHATLELTYLTQ